MTQTIRFVLAIHNHQPVGNFEGVFEQAYQQSYRPFLELLDRYPSLTIALHTSGSLMEWLDAHHPEYVDRLAALVATGRIEIVGGAFYEPILTMIPRRDRVGQIESYSRWLEGRLGAKVRGVWIPERVWEQSLVADIAAAGIDYTILDDFHFKNAGLTANQLHGHYVSEDDGRLISVFPGSERLRYVIPFGDPHETIDHLGRIAAEQPGSVVVFGDDGEKFGTWPETYRHVYENGWLDRFFSAIAANQQWIKVTTLAEAVDNVAPLGKVYLPDSSYREMTEWALPVGQLLEYERLRHDFERDERWPRLAPFARGGFWRNFKVKYPESNEMYCRMMQISRRLDEATRGGRRGEALEQARTELYRGQCNCGYWHGAFGGVYLPHLRNAVYKHLIAAENLIERATRPESAWAEATIGDFNLDARQEVYLSNDRLAAFVAPAQGGQLYELDVRSICHNLLATLSRRPEAYHQKVLQGAQRGDGAAASIHDRVVFKQPGLDQKLQYDSYSRKGLIDHFFPLDAGHADVVAGRAAELGDFVGGVYEARVRRSADRVQLVLSRAGSAAGRQVKIVKTLTLDAGSSALDVEYQLEGLPPGESLHFGVELNLAGLPAGADDRYYHDGRQGRMGQLGAELDLGEVEAIHLTDEWQGIDVGLKFNRPSRLWSFPLATVSQSEGGFELVHQQVCLIPHWIAQADDQGRYAVSFTIAIDTSQAESRFERAAEAAAS